MFDENPILVDDQIISSFLFSYWILAWFILYYCVDANTKWGKYIKDHGSPIAGLWMSFLYGLTLFVHIWLYNPNIRLLILFAVMLITIKIVPLYLLRSHVFDRYRLFSSSLVLAVLFLFYTIYLHVNGTNSIEVYSKVEKSILLGENKTPFLRLLSKLIPVSASTSS